MLYIVLFEPEIPQNTGNIARTCAATNTSLILVHPLGFSISDKAVKHAGLDYWKDVNIIEVESTEKFMNDYKDKNLYFFTTKSEKIYSDEKYDTNDDIYFIFGKESRGIEEDILVKNKNKCVRLPMVGNTRSLNLSNTVAIAAYEYYRQKGWDNFTTKGDLHRLTWEE